MSIMELIVQAIERRWDRKRKRLIGPLGDYYRNGGNDQLYDVPVTTNDLVIDAGGYKGEWSARMAAQFGCRSEVFEPSPDYADYCKRLFRNNERIRVHASALGGLNRTAKFTLNATGTSEFLSSETSEMVFDAKVQDVKPFLDSLGEQYVACLKINIEGGEYEVLERLLDTQQILQFKSLLIQFHMQPEGWESRREAIIERLNVSHKQVWCYPMLWEKWISR